MASAAASARANRAFLLACAIRQLDDWAGREDGLRELDASDWNAIAAHAMQQGFTGLLARNLAWAERRTGLRIPVTEALAAAQRGQLIQQLARKAAAHRVAEALAARDIPVVAFKGIVLAEEVYGDLSLRAFRDFDAMVPRARLDEAYAVALELGYRLTHLDHVREHVRAGAHAAGMMHRDGSGFDLHWAIAPDLSDPRHDATVWKRCVPAPAGTALPGLRLGPEITLIHLAKHFHSHQYGSVKPLVDFHVAWKSFAGRIDERDLRAAALELELLPVLEIAVALCERTFDAGTMAPLPGAGGRTVNARIARCLVTNDLMLNGMHRSRLGNWMRYLLASGSLAAAARSFVDILVPGKLRLTQLFDRPFRATMYPLYYWRQLVKVVTLARK